VVVVIVEVVRVVVVAAFFAIFIFRSLTSAFTASVVLGAGDETMLPPVGKAVEVLEAATINEAGFVVAEWCGANTDGA
jgi:hypothetical protein